ncbi:hypothetical protein D9M69_646590 [compost metagenome]
MKQPASTAFGKHCHGTQVHALAADRVEQVANAQLVQLELRALQQLAGLTQVQQRRDACGIIRQYTLYRIAKRPYIFHIHFARRSPYSPSTNLDSMFF